MPTRREAFFSPYLSLPYFSGELLRLDAQKFQIPRSRLNSYIYKALRDAQIIHLKKNFYVTRSFFEAHRTDISYLFFLANNLLKPSYVSLEAALQYYGLLAEGINFTINSVTTKLPRQFKNSSGIYTYRNINEKLFTGFRYEKNNFEFIIASPQKALFDYLYYRTNQFTKNVHSSMLDELRIYTDSLSIDEKKQFSRMVADFTSIKISI